METNTDNNTSGENMEFSPFTAPKKEAKGPQMAEGMKVETITDAQLDGNASSGTPFDDAPKDAPEFKLPNFDDTPKADFPPPGGGNSGGGNSGGGSGSAPNEGSKMDPEFAKGLSEYTAKWLVDIYFRLLIMGLTSYAKINKTEVVQGVRDGLIDSKFLKYVDEANKNVDKGITVSEDEKNFIIEPLKYFLEVKKVQVKPEYMFLGSLVMVSGQMFFRANEIKKDNKDILDRIINESAKSRTNGRANPSDDNEQMADFSNGPRTSPNSGSQEPGFSVDNPDKQDDIIEFKDSDIEVMDSNNTQ